MREWSATFCIKEVTFCIMTAGSHEKTTKMKPRNTKVRANYHDGIF